MTKYELTDADRERLDMIAQKASGKPKVNDIAWEIASDWFASLPVVSRKAVERALGDVTEEEIDQFDDQLVLHRGDGDEHDWDKSLRLALNDFAARRRAMLDDVTAEPSKVEPVLAGDDLRKRLDWQIREIVRERGERTRAGRDGDVGNRIHWGVASAMTSLYDSLFPRSLDDDLGWGANAVVEPIPGPTHEWFAKAADAEDASRSVSVGGLAVDTGMYVAPAEPTPEPQPAIDVAAELAKLRKAVDLFRESQSERLNDLYRRLNAIESAVQRKPRWWWW